MVQGHHRKRAEWECSLIPDRHRRLFVGDSFPLQIGGGNPAGLPISYIRDLDPPIRRRLIPLPDELAGVIFGSGGIVGDFIVLAAAPRHRKQDNSNETIEGLAHSAAFLRRARKGGIYPATVRIPKSTGAIDNPWIEVDSFLWIRKFRSSTFQSFGFSSAR